MMAIEDRLLAYKGIASSLIRRDLGRGGMLKYSPAQISEMVRQEADVHAQLNILANKDRGITQYSPTISTEGKNNMDVQQIAEKLLADLEKEIENNQRRIEGARLLFTRMVEAARVAQEAAAPSETTAVNSENSDG